MLFKKVLYVSSVVFVLAACDHDEKTTVSSEEHEYRSIDYRGFVKENIPKTDLYPIEPYAASSGTDVSADEAIINKDNYYETPFYMGGTATLSDDYWGYGENREGASFAIDVTSHTQDSKATFYLDRGIYKDLYDTLLINDVELFLTGVVTDKGDDLEIIPTGYVTDVELIKARPEKSYLPSEELQGFMNQVGISTTEREVRFNPYEFDGRYFAYEGIGQMTVQTSNINDAVDPLKYFHIQVNQRTVNGMIGWILYFEREKFQDLFEDAKTGLIELNTVNLYDSGITDTFSRNLAYVREAEYSVVKPAFSTVTEEGRHYMEQQGIQLTGHDVLYDPYSYFDTPFFLEGTAELSQEENAQTFTIRLPVDPYYKKDPFATRNEYLNYSYQIASYTFKLSKEKYPELYEKLQNQAVDVRMITEINRELVEGHTPSVGPVVDVEW